MKNLEIKARYNNAAAVEKVQQLQYSDHYDLKQVDTYFNIPDARLKLRTINEKTYELIYYLRPDQSTARQSSYEIYKCEDPTQLTKILTLLHGVKNNIKKRRQVYIYQESRIHIDFVEELGEFIEFEIVMIPGRTEQEATQIMQNLLEHFQIKNADLVNKSYTDLKMEQD
jgi:predicted adenylyl cyclase CyaB